jgi:dipeptidyl aminopeptidase/acylaminoacyl peptidase
MRSFMLSALVAASVLGYSCLAGAQDASNLPPVEAFGSLPVLSRPKLSPDGLHLATIQSLRGRPTLLVYQLNAPPGTKPTIVPSSDWLIADFAWAKNDRLIVTLKQSAKAAGDDRVRTWVRAVAIDTDGNNFAVLMENQRTLDNNPYGADLVDIDLDDPDNVFMSLFVEKTAIGFAYGTDADIRFNLLKVDVRSGRAQSVFEGQSGTRRWLMDGHGGVIARIDQTFHPLKEYVKVRQSGDWTDAGEFDATGDRGSGLTGMTEDGKGLAMYKTDDLSLSVLVRHDMTSGSDTLLFADPKYDVGDVIEDEWTGRVVGATYIDDKQEFRYFDPDRQAMQHSLEEVFPNMSVEAVSSDLKRDKVIVGVDGPRSPLRYYLLDRATSQMETLGAAYPHLDKDDLGEMKPYPYKARDGLDIPAYITLPPGRVAKNLPAVVFPHGGPDARDALGFDWWAQFMANRGYVVLQPNYRGSSGYGHKYTEAGLHQWGLKMQDDISDGVKKMIADGIADPKRICIVGASYGGYAALAGAAFTPDLYACAIAVAGVSDLPEVLSSSRSDYGYDSQAVSFWASRIGSVANDADQLNATSPARHADKVKCPILLMHGEGDTTVRINQSELMEKALKDAGKPVEFIRFPGEDHYLNLSDTRIRVLTETERFLAKYIGK